jgi:hypothetical protein
LPGARQFAWACTRFLRVVLGICAVGSVSNTKKIQLKETKRIRLKETKKKQRKETNKK